MGCNNRLNLSKNRKRNLFRSLGADVQPNRVVQTLKLFSADGDDHYIRNGFDIYLDALRPFTRRLTGVRMALTTLSGIVITAIFCRLATSSTHTVPSTSELTYARLPSGVKSSDRGRCPTSIVASSFPVLVSSTDTL